MARRPSGLKPPRGTLGTLIRTTLQQAGVVREAIVNGAREGRSRLDDVRAGRRRQEALAELGEIVLGLIRDGEIDVGELPEAKELVRHLDEIDANAGVADEHVAPRAKRDDDDGTVSSSRYAPPTKRAGRPTTVWRPPAQSAVDPLPPTDPGRKSLPRDPHRQGGIQFDNDDDLAEYMHPDDVPPKPPTEGDA